MSQQSDPAATLTAQSAEQDPQGWFDLARFGLRAVLGGSIATFMTATIAGVLTYLG